MAIVKNCLRCKKEFKTYPYKIKIGKGKYCSRKCANVFGKAVKLTKSCLYCNREFEFYPYQIKIGKGKFCSVKCSAKYHTQNIYISCKNCKKKFKTIKAVQKSGKGIFCSKNCYITIHQVKKVCGFCKKEFVIPKARDKKAKFCSIKCHTEYQKIAYKGKRSRSWKGGKYKSDGYVYVYKSNHPRVIKNKRPYMQEHILVMEKHLDRYLEEKEQVHHINGIKDDNRIENLELMTISDHSRLHHYNRKRDKKGKYI